MHTNQKEILFHALSSRFVLINVEFDRDDFEKLVEVEIQYKKTWFHSVTEIRN